MLAPFYEKHDDVACRHKGGVPRAASLISPSGDVATRFPTDRWNRVAIATEYYLWVSNPSSMPVIRQWYVSSAVCTGDVCAVTPSTALVDGEHRWWIQTKGVGGEGPWSAPMRFDVMSPAPTGVPTLVSPAGTVTTCTPSYTWNEVATATDYYLWVSNPSSVPVIQQWYAASSVCSGATCAVMPSVSLANGAHTWWVQAKNELGVGPWSAAVNFTVAAPGTAALVSPQGTITAATPAYRWKAVAGATEYYLWVSNGSAPVIQQWHFASSVCAASTCSVTPSTSLASGGYTWWIQTKNDIGVGPWSMGMTFTVKP